MDDDEVDLGTLSYPWSWKAFGTVVTAFVSQVASAVEDATANITIMLAAANNHEIDQRDFAQAVAQDIESLSQEE